MLLLWGKLQVGTTASNQSSQNLYKEHEQTLCCCCTHLLNVLHWLQYCYVGANRHGFVNLIQVVTLA
jgi:hypothetical protein